MHLCSSASARAHVLMSMFPCFMRSFGVLSAFTGQLVSFPLETVARRLQVGAWVHG